MVAMIETTIVLIFISGVRLPVREPTFAIERPVTMIRMLLSYQRDGDGHNVVFAKRAAPAHGRRYILGSLLVIDASLQGRSSVRSGAVLPRRPARFVRRGRSGVPG